MRIETNAFVATSGLHIGHRHHDKCQNGQDALELRRWPINGTEYICGVVSDGCGGAIQSELQKQNIANSSEVGANILSRLAVLNLMKTTPYVVPLDMNVNLLFQSLRLFIEQSLSNNDWWETLISIQRFWLSTIVGFIMNDNEGIVFHCGDGVAIINDTIHIFDQQGTPHYLAYASHPDPESIGIATAMIPTKFEIIGFVPSEVNKLMIATDGWDTINDSKFSAWESAHPDEELSRTLDGQQWGKHGVFGLKKWMNTRFVRGYFEDDCGIITLERK